MAHTNEFPLSEESIEWLKEYLRANDMYIRQLALEIGIPRATLQEVFQPNHNVSVRNRDKIEFFIQQKKAAVQPTVVMRQIPSSQNMPQTQLKGDEVPQIDEKRLAFLTGKLVAGLGIIIPVLAEILNGDAGTRVHFQDIARQQLFSLLALSRAMQNDGVRDKVLAELRERGVTSFNQLLQEA